MSSVDIEALVGDVSEDNPCGDDLEYDSEFGALDRLAQVKPEQQFGDTIIPAEEPDWREVRDSAVSLFSRTKDLRVAAYLVKALIRTDGFEGFADGLEVTHRLIRDRWEGIHPLLDPDDDNDPTMRVNVLVSLCDADGVLRPLRAAPLVSSRMMGRFGLRDLAIASGEIPAPANSDTPPPDSGAINAAFMDVPLEELEATGTAIDRAIETIGEIETTVTAQVGAANAASMGAVIEVLREARSELNERLAQRGVTVGGGDEPAEDAEGAPAAGGQAAAGPRAIPGEISSREDVIRTLDRLCQYYERHEPSSPIPMLLTRAKRLVTMSFMEILGDLAPEGVGQAKIVGGIKEEQEY